MIKFPFGVGRHCDLMIEQLDREYDMVSKMLSALEGKYLYVIKQDSLWLSVGLIDHEGVDMVIGGANPGPLFAATPMSLNMGLAALATYQAIGTQNCKLLAVTSACGQRMEEIRVAKDMLRRARTEAGPDGYFYAEGVVAVVKLDAAPQEAPESEEDESTKPTVAPSRNLH